MRWIGFLGLLIAAVVGCVRVRPLAEPMGPPVPLYCDNPLLMPVRDWSALWEALTHVIDDYFRIENEEPVRMVGDTLTEGRIDTFPETGSTVLEPWRGDSADPYEKVESTLQSIRRQAHVRVIPSEGGFLVDVTVFKELEDVKRPAHVSAGAATFRTEGSLTRVVNPIGDQEVNRGWIRLGRDRALEQRILAHLQETLGVQGLSPPPPAVPAVQPSGPSCQPGSPAGSPGCSPSPRCASGPESRTTSSLPRTTYRPVVAQSTTARNAPPDWQTILRWTDRPDDDAFLPRDALTVDSCSPELGSDPGMLGSEVDAPGEAFGPGFVADLGSLDEARPPPEGYWARWGEEFHRLLDLSIQDYSRFYSPSELVALSGGIGLAAVFANVKIDDHTIDENFQQWHHEHVATHNARKFAYIAGELGNGRHFLPFYGVCVGAGQSWPDNPNARVLGEWGDRSLRSFLVGAPVILALQYGLGAGRPEDKTNGSRWVPFHAENSASGHAFIGGINFLNAAMMTDNVPLKSALYVASVVPGWTRMIRDKHYFSQVMLGWWVAYVSTTAVDWTEQKRSDWQITPAVSEEGLSIHFLRAW